MLHSHYSVDQLNHGRAIVGLPQISFGDRAPRETRSEKRTFAAGRKAEHQYARNLRSVARQIGEIARAFHGSEDPGAVSKMEQMLRGYSEILRPWARVQGERMLHDVSRRDEAVWHSLGKQMGRALREEIRNAPTGREYARMLEEQVHYITSLPLDAARRVQELSTGALYSGARPDEIKKQILLTGHVSRSRAELIARTAVAGASSTLTRARAEHVGSKGYIWRTAGDADVRKEHRRLNGQFFTWHNPPVAGSRGERAHAGQIYNCRCWPDPVFPE